MDVLLATIVFPWPSEAFAGVEVRALKSVGARVRVRALRGAHRHSGELLRDWGLEDLDATSVSRLSLAQGLWFIVRHPRMALGTLFWLIRSAWSRPALLGRCLLLIPRLFSIFAECMVDPPRILYVFWGHYPSVLAYMVQKWLPGVHVAMSLSAYDLVYAFPPSIEVARDADSLWTITRANLPALEKLGLDVNRVRVSPRGIDLSQVPADCHHKNLNRFVVVARLEVNKGVDDVLLAFAMISGENPDATLTVIGEGPDRARLEDLARNMGLGRCVEFYGGIVHSVVYECLADASVLLLLSRSPAERLPNAVKEAMACRCLCIVTDTPGIMELLQTLENPMVVDQGDWRRAGECLATVIREPHRFAADRDTGRDFVFSNLDARVIARRRLEVWSRPQ